MAHTPGRPTHSENTESRREAIVQTARRIVDENGPGAVSAEQVTREVGLSRPMLYHYFPGMPALVSAVIDTYVDRFARHLEVWESHVTPSLASDLNAWSLLMTAHIRASLVDGCPLLIGAIKGELPGAWTIFLGRCAEVVADHALVNMSPALAPLRGVPEARSTIFMAIVGFAGMLYHFPDMDNEAASTVFAGIWATGDKPETLVAEATEIAGVAAAATAQDVG